MSAFRFRNCRLWSPEDPFLYELEVSTGEDALADPVRDAELPAGPEDGPCDPQRQALFPPRHQLVHLPFLRRSPAERPALARRLGAEAAPHVQVHALERGPLLHRLPAGNVVPDRGRGRLAHRRRVPALVHELVAEGDDQARTSSRSIPSGCATAGTIPAWSSGTPRTRRWPIRRAGPTRPCRRRARRSGRCGAWTSRTAPGTTAGTRPSRLAILTRPILTPSATAVSASVISPGSPDRRAAPRGSRSPSCRIRAGTRLSSTSIRGATSAATASCRPRR